MIWRHTLLSASIACYSLWIWGCSSKDEDKAVPETEQQPTESTDSGNEPKDGSIIPEITKNKPEIYGSSTNSNIILLDSKGIWVLKETGKPYSGTVVFQLDGYTWEEGFKDGIKTSLRGWDEEKKSIELYSWNTNGTKKINPSATPIKLGD